MRQLLCLFTAVTLGHADAASLIWTGDPTISFFHSDAEGGATASSTPTGMMGTASCMNAGTSCTFEFDAYRPFTVTKAGNFVVSTSLDAEITALMCVPVLCSTSTFVRGTLSGNGPGLSISKTFHATSQDPELFLSITDASSELITLGLGDYTIEQNFTDIMFASGDNSIDFTANSSIVPTPEPRGYVVFGLVAMLWLRHRRHAISRLRLMSGSPQ